MNPFTADAADQLAARANDEATATIRRRAKKAAESLHTHLWVCPSCYSAVSVHCDTGMQLLLKRPDDA